jgi:hypothetical protein
MLPPIGGALGLLDPVGSPRAPASLPDREQDETPRPASPDVAMTPAEETVIRDVLSTANRTSYAPSTLEPDVQNTHFHDMELCILLHALDDHGAHEVAKKALRKAVRQRVKRLGIKYDHNVGLLRLWHSLKLKLVQSLQELRKSFHDHDPSIHLARHLTGLSDGTALPKVCADIYSPLLFV